MSRLNGVDVSGWDSGIDCASLTADFVIVKSTEGVQGTVYNQGYRSMADAAAGSGKLIGFYHYANGGDPVAEADCFWESVADYRGRALLALDWEGQGNDLFGSGEDVSWCKRFMDHLAEASGSTPILYTSKGVCNSYDWSPVASRYRLWGAEYAYSDYTYQGYPDDPWQSQAGWGAWGHDELLHQYGYVNPLPNNGGIDSLDGEVFNGDAALWASLCGSAPSQQAPTVTPIASQLPVPERIAECAEHIANHDAHGYSQDNRLGDGTTEAVTFSDGTFAIIHGGDYDCSSMAQTCANAAISGKVDTPITYMWTGTQYEEMTAAGFVCLDFDYHDTRRGDVLWVKGHTGVALGDGMQADAHGDEYGGLSGPNQGDQTGWEIEVRALQAYWTYTFRYAGPNTTLQGGEVRTSQTGDEMICIIRPNGAGYLAYFDGQRLHPLSNPDELEALNMVYKATHGGADIPQMELGTPDAPWATRLSQALARTEPSAQDATECLLKLDGTNTMAYFDGTSLHPLASPDEANAIRTAYRIAHGTEIREADFGSKDSPMGKHLATALRRTA